MRLWQIHFQNVRPFQRFGDGLLRITVLAQVDVQKLHALAGSFEQEMQRKPRSRRALGQRAETKAVGHCGEFERLSSQFDEIVSHLGSNEESGVAPPVERDLNRSGGG